MTTGGNNNSSDAFPWENTQQPAAPSNDPWSSAPSADAWGAPTATPQPAAPQFAAQPPAPVPAVYQGQPMGAPGYGYVGAPVVQTRSRIVALLLAFFFGAAGLHNFYLGHVVRGIFQFGTATMIGLLTASFFGSILAIFPAIVLGFWVIVEFIMIAAAPNRYFPNPS